MIGRLEDSGAINTNELLSLHKPWYFHKLNSLIAANQTEPYNRRNNDRVLSTRLLGQKSYELTNHLSNVMAVVSDKVEEVVPSFVLNTTSLPADATLRPSMKAEYDYYPFGSLMPLRYKEDATVTCTPVTKTIYNTQNIDEGLYHYEDGDLQTYGFDVSTIDGTLEQELSGTSAKFTGTSENSHLVFLMDATVTATKTYLVTASLANNDVESANPIRIEVQQTTSGSSWTSYETLTSTSLNSEGIIYIAARANTEAAMRIVFYQSLANLSIMDVTMTRLDVLSSTITEVVCSHDDDFSDDYRFGFNGQEKDNEIAGAGNHNTAQFWEYDTRLGRRWNKDPIVKAWESSYATFSNSPLFFADPSGLTSQHTVDTKNKVVEVNVTIYYNRNTPGMDELVADTKNSSESDWNKRKDKVEINGSSYKVNYNVQYVGLESDALVHEALKADLSGNALFFGSCPDGAAANYDNKTREITFQKGSIMDGGSLNHEIGHALGLPHATGIKGTNVFDPDANIYNKPTQKILNNGKYPTASGYIPNTPIDQNPTMSYGNGPRGTQNAEILHTVITTVQTAESMSNQNTHMFMFIQGGCTTDGNHGWVSPEVDSVK